MSWLRSQLYLILHLGAVPKLLPSTPHIVIQFSVASKADQPIASARSPSPRWAFHPSCWAAHSERSIQAKLWYLTVPSCCKYLAWPGKRHTGKKTHSSSAPCKIKTLKQVSCSALATHKSNNGSSKDTVGQDTAYAQGGLMDWQPSVSLVS